MGIDCQLIRRPTRVQPRFDFNKKELACFRVNAEYIRPSADARATQAQTEFTYYLHTARIQHPRKIVGNDIVVLTVVGGDDDLRLIIFRRQRFIIC